MKKWEYLEIRLGEHGWLRNYELVLLNEIGIEGWELVGFYTDPDEHPRAVFKRQRSGVVKASR